jgi:cell division protein FtsA
MANLEVKEIILEPIASSHAVLSEEEKEAGVVLVDIGGGTTDVAIFYEGILRHTAVIPFGGNIITDDIKQGCNIMRKYAEKLKVKFGSASPMESQQNEIVGIPGVTGSSQKKIISVRTLASIIEARMSEIIEFVNYEIVNSGYDKRMGAGIVLTGGGSQLKHLPQLVMLRTGLDARIGLPTEHLANTNKQLEHLASPTYATGIGLVLNGFQSKAKSVGPTIITEDKSVDKVKSSKVNPGSPRENFFTKMFTKIGEKVTDTFKDED